MPESRETTEQIDSRGKATTTSGSGHGGVEELETLLSLTEPRASHSRSSAGEGRRKRNYPRRSFLRGKGRYVSEGSLYFLPSLGPGTSRNGSLADRERTRRSVWQNQLRDIAWQVFVMDGTTSHRKLLSMPQVFHAEFDLRHS